jgi:hypothetical protein
MSEHPTGDPAAADPPEREHDAANGPINAPGDEPDAESPTEQDQGDAGRLDADDL